MALELTNIQYIPRTIGDSLNKSFTAYIKIDGISVSKDKTYIHVAILDGYDGQPISSDVVDYAHDINTPFSYTDAYTYLKTLTRYASATDV